MINVLKLWINLFFAIKKWLSIDLHYSSSWAVARNYEKMLEILT